MPVGDPQNCETHPTSDGENVGGKHLLVKQVSNDNNTAETVPIQIDVHGTDMDLHDHKYVVVREMEDGASPEEDSKDHVDSLTEAKNSKNKIESCNVETDKRKSDLIENEDDGATKSDAKLDKEIRNSHIKSLENSAGATDENDDKIVENNNEQNKDTGDENKDKSIEGAETDQIKEKRADEEITVLVAEKDDVASIYSLFMERDFRYYFQHPYCRMFICYFVVFCNFLIYAEDPVAHSRKECYIPMIGNDFAFLLTRYPRNAWSVLKVMFWLAGLVLGCFVGKLFVHGYLFNLKLRLKMFSDSQGSWMIMFFVSLITIFISSLFYNIFLLIGGDALKPYRISDLMGVRNDIFMKAAACGTWCGDFFTAWMVTDIMLQEKLYPGWARPIRTWWKSGWHRIVLFWIVVFVTSFAVIFVIATDYIQWDKLNRGFLPTNEVSRAFLASMILVMDFMIVMQDWDFPYFTNAIDIKLPGMNTAHIRFSIPKCMKRESWQVHISGKWFNYGILFMVMLLDLNMWKNQIFYNPYDYGQYTGPEGSIYTVQDDYSLVTFNKSQTTYDFRNSTMNPVTGNAYIAADTHMNTRYLAYSMMVKGIAFIPSIAALIIFGVLIGKFGRFKPTKKDPYAGRLKKRVRKRLSFKNLKFRLPWRRREEVRRKIHAVPKLLYLKSKGRKGEEEKIEEQEIPAEGFVEVTAEKTEKTEKVVKVKSLKK